MRPLSLGSLEHLGDQRCDRRALAPGQGHVGEERVALRGEATPRGKVPLPAVNAAGKRLTVLRAESCEVRLHVWAAALHLPATDRPLLWHIGCWPRLMEFAGHLPPGPTAVQVSHSMRDYVETIEPRLGHLCWQVTHNDPSPFNMMVTDQGLGFIDFGDGCHSPRIQDLAIAAGHVVTDPGLPLGGADYLIAGYASVIPLSGVETSLLVGLMKARQSALILINHWRAHLFPAEAQYIKKNVARAERGLGILTALDQRSGAIAVEAAISHRP